MTFAERNRIFIKKLQSLPDNQKKIILWTIVGILALVMGFFWVRGAIKNFSEIGTNLQSIEIPSIDTSDIPKLPSQETLQATIPTN